MKYKGLLPLLLLPMLFACEDEDDPVPLTLGQQVGFEEAAMADCLDFWASEFGWASLEDVTELSCYRNGIASIVGLEKLPNLIEFNIGQTAVETLDFSQLPQLQRLTIHENPYLTSLNLSGSLQLTFLDVTTSPLTELNLSHLPELTYANIRQTYIKKLIVWDTPKLHTLAANGHLIESIDLAGNYALTSLHLRGNKLKSIDLSPAPALSLALLDSNQLETINISQNSELVGIRLDNNKLQSIDLNNNSKLTHVNVLNNPLTEETRQYLNTIDWIPNLEW